MDLENILLPVNSDPERQIPHVFHQFGLLAPIPQMLEYDLKSLKKLEK